MTMGIFLPGERGYGYKNSVFHRIVPGYIVQGKAIYARLTDKTIHSKFIQVTVISMASNSQHCYSK